MINNDDKNAEKMRTIVYIDGFNLYYGCLKGSSYKWLNPSLLCQNILSSKHQLTEIKFFTAKISSTKDDPQKATRQQFYMRALSTLDNFKIVLGHFNTHHVKMRLVDPIEIESTIPFINTVKKKTVLLGRS